MTDTVTTGDATSEATGQAVAQTTQAQTTQTAQATTQADTQTAQAIDPADWRASITDPKVKEFSAKFTSPADAAAAALQFRQKLSNAINIPGKDATPEERADFNKKLGIPESPDKYEFDVPDFIAAPEQAPQVKEGLKPLLDVLHKAGATPDVVKAGLAWYFEDMKNAQEAQAKRGTEALEKTEAELRKEWGNEFDPNVEFAKRAYGAVADPAFKEIVEQVNFQGRPLGSHPAFLKVFAKYGRMTNEGGAQFPEGTQVRTDAETKMQELTNKAYDALNRGDRSTANRLYAERDALSKSLYPEAA